MTKLRKILCATALSLMALLTLAGCTTSTYAVMTTSEGSTNPEGGLYDPNVPWYETQEPMKRPAWTKRATGEQPE